MNSGEKYASSLRWAMLVGSAWMIAMRWMVRGINFLSVVVLARLLTPDDFGLETMNSMFIMFLEITT